MEVIRNQLAHLTCKQIVLYTLLVLCFISSILFVNYNYSFYKTPIATIVETDLQKTTETVDHFQNKDQVTTQHLTAQLKNGKEKGQRIHLTNEYSSSGAYDHAFQAGDEVFVSIDSNSPELTGTIQEVKRDKYLLMMIWVFIFTLLMVGQKQGLFAIISLAVNAVLLSIALDVYIQTSGISLLLICSISAVLFTVISLFLVNGFNEKTYAAIIATLLGTFLSLLITYLVMEVTSEKGLKYEEIQFITRPYQMVFMAGLFIGSLGAVMDVAITMSSSIFGVYEENPGISAKALRKSGLDIGKDIMGTMTNILFFAYVSGSIPILILYLKNANSLGFTLSINLSLELARALAGGIGIVLTIPIGLYTAIFFVNRKRARG